MTCALRPMRHPAGALLLAALTIAIQAIIGLPARADTAGVAAHGGPSCPGQSPHNTAVSRGDFAKVNGVVPRPVVLVHGWDDSYTAMQGYAGLLIRSKVLHEPLRPYLFDYSANSGHWAAVPAIAACLADYVNSVSGAYHAAGGDGKVLALGHSMGGLAIRFSADSRYAAHPDGGNLGGVTTLDTPHLGSPWGDTPQAQLLQDFAQLKAGNWLEGMFPWPIGSDGQTCLATHAGTTGMPPGCPVPPWLAGNVPVAEIGGDITVQRQVMGYTIDTTDTGGDSVVATASSLGYVPSSGPGVAPATMVAPAAYTDACTITTGQVEAGIGGSLLSAFWSVFLDLFSRPPGTSFWNSPLTQPRATFLSLINKYAPCAHTEINNPATDPFASLDVLRALNADIDHLAGTAAQDPALNGMTTPLPSGVTVPTTPACQALPSGTFTALLGTTVGSVIDQGGACYIEAGGSEFGKWVAFITYQRDSSRDGKQVLAYLVSSADRNLGGNVYDLIDGFEYFAVLPGNTVVLVALGLRSDESCNDVTDPRRCIRGSPAEAEAALRYALAHA
jgi:hypothetical protein